MPTLTMAATSTTPETLNALMDFVNNLPEGPARDAMEAVAQTLRSGRDIIIAGADDSVTPNQAARVLGVGRVHLYKVLDAGALPYPFVGNRDRRIAMADLRDYVAKTEELRHQIARNTANSRAARALAIDEV